jgi:hypothetical protein
MGPPRDPLQANGVKVAPQLDSSAIARPDPSSAASHSQGTAAAPCTQTAATQPEAGPLQHAIANEDVSSLGSCHSDCGLSNQEGSVVSNNQRPHQAAEHLADAQHVRELEDQLAAAAARETLLQDSIAAREDTIRCTA